jgi:ABC-type multidrug transport system, permease component
MNTIRLIKNIYSRMITNKAFMITTFIIIPITVLLSIYFTDKLNIKGNIAIVGNNEVKIDVNKIRVSYINEEPPLSELVSNKYDAVVRIANGKTEIKSVKGEDFRESIEKVLGGESINSSFNTQNRGVGANIIGYITMFILFQGSILFSYFYKEKENGITKRILSHPISSTQYLLAHFIGVFLITFIPTSIIVLSMVDILKLNTTVSNFQFIYIIALLSMFGAAFGILIASIVKSEDNGILIGNMLIIITTLLSGSFFNVNNNGALKVISSILPQKIILDFTMAIENSKSMNYIGIMSIVIFSLILIGGSIIVNKNKLVNNNW